MTPRPTDISRHTIWQINRRHADIWRCWDGEVVIYDELSGDTMKLDIIMSAIFRFMLHAPVTETQIAQHLVTTLKLKVDAQPHQLAALALHRLRAAELIQPA